jgi:hypothetical protein
MSGNRRGDADGHDDIVVRKAEHGWVVGRENVSDLTSAMVLADLFAADRSAEGQGAENQGAEGKGAVAEGQGAEGEGRSAEGEGQGAEGKSASAGGQDGSAEDEKSVDAGGAPHGAVARPRVVRPRPNDSGPLAAVPNLDEPKEAERLAVTVAQLEHALASRVRVEQAIGVLAERHRLRPREAFDLLRRAARARGARVTEMAQDVVASAANPLLRLPEELARTHPEARPRGSRSGRRGRHAAGR